MSNIIRLEPKERKELVCPFRTITTSSQLQDGRVIQLIEYPPCHYDICPYYIDDNCSRVVNTLV